MWRQAEQHSCQQINTKAGANLYHAYFLYFLIAYRAEGSPVSSVPGSISNIYQVTIPHLHVLMLDTERSFATALSCISFSGHMVLQRPTNGTFSSAYLGIVLF